jgi:hypothetical protein
MTDRLNQLWTRAVKIGNIFITFPLLSYLSYATPTHVETSHHPNLPLSSSNLNGSFRDFDVLTDLE